MAKNVESDAALFDGGDDCFSVKIYKVNRVFRVMLGVGYPSVGQIKLAVRALRNIDFYCCDLFISIMRNVYRCDGYGELKNKMLKHPLSNMTSYSLYNIYTSTISKKLNKDIYNYNSADLFRTRKVLDLVEFNLLKNRMIKKLYEYILEYKQIINGDYDVVFLGDIEKCSDDFIPF